MGNCRQPAVWPDSRLARQVTSPPGGSHLPQHTLNLPPPCKIFTEDLCPLYPASQWHTHPNSLLPTKRIGFCVFHAERAFQGKQHTHTSGFHNKPHVLHLMIELPGKGLRPANVFAKLQCEPSKRPQLRDLMTRLWLEQRFPARLCFSHLFRQATK